MYRILLVEDDPGIAQAVCAHLRQWELDARCVQNFRAVMEEFTAFDPPEIQQQNRKPQNDTQRRRIPHRSQRQVVQRKRDDKNDREQEKRGDLPRFSAQIL